MFLVGASSSNAISNHGPNQHKLSCTSQLVVRSKCINSHEKSSCASLLTVHAKCFIKADANISLSDLEGVQSAQINDQTLWLIVNYICLPNFEGAQKDTPPTIRKEYFKLIDASNAKGVHASTNIQNSGFIVASIKSKASFHFCKDCRIFRE
jgi:hypothetical protein